MYKSKRQEFKYTNISYNNNVIMTITSIIQNFPANTSSLNQRWNVDRQCSSTLIFGWKWKLSWRIFIDVVSTLIELLRFNVDEPTLFQRWNLVENESWADVCLSTLFQHWQNNVETALIELCWFNVDDPMLFQRWY